MACNHCEEFTPLAPRAPGGRRGRAAGCRAIEPRDAGARRAPGSAAARSCCARAPRCSPSTAPRSCGSASSRRGSPRRPAATSRVLVSIFLDGGIDSLSVLAPTDDPIYRALRPTLALPDREPGRRSPRTRRLRWNPAAAAFDDLHRRGQDVGAARRSATTSPDQSHFTSRHYWEVGGLQPDEVTGWMGRLLDTIGTPGQPASGPVARRLALAGAGEPARCRWRRSTGPPTTSGRRASGASPRSSCTARSASSGGRAPSARTPALRGRGRRRRPGDAR